MKLILSLLFVFSTSCIFSQNLQKALVILDAETKLPVQDATVTVLKTKQFYLSNKLGEVTICIKGESALKITHATYETNTVRASFLKDNNTILLKKNTKELDEIIITKQHPQKILKMLIDNSIAHFTMPARLKVYEREFLKLDDKYAYFNDGLLNFQLTGNPNIARTDILIEQNRSYGLKDEFIGDDAVGYNLDNISENYYNFKYLEFLLTTIAKKDFEFIIKSYSKTHSYYIMQIIPTDNAVGLYDHYYIVYDYKKKLIVEVSSVLSDQMLAKLSDRPHLNPKEIEKSSFKTIYKIDDNQYYFFSSREEIKLKRKINKVPRVVEVSNTMITTAFSTKHFTYKDNEVFKGKTLYNVPNHILTNYWDISGLAATDEELSIIQKLSELGK